MHYADYKTILSPKNGINLYRGCTHGCIYCDSRSKCYQLNHDFEDIEVKRDALKILENQFKKKRKPVQVLTGAMCDPYIPLEQELRLTRGMLELVLKYNFGVSILTKSTRILQDFDLLKQINDKTKCVVSTTLTTYDENLCKKIEPNVSTTFERFEMLEVMRDAGIPTVVWLCPLLPFINDDVENLKGILDYCVRAKVTGILYFGFGTTMRDGSRDFFYESLDKTFPGMKQKYIATYGNAYQCSSPNHSELSKLFHETCKKHGILHTTQDVFSYLSVYETKRKQLSIF